ncbi:helix-turn-helix transcriptional regulator [Pseudomonas sp.]|uniref:helix-turn-helix domain-containing protein n=1 Tax=Pseudomonas sp. TaxID=306 RepID=UPI002626CE5D|nr:helix-turn-helix transcriptional regulator [Pseudomonas sp.]
MKNFGKRLRAERVRLNLTQKELARLCGVQANAQGHYENGERHPGSGYLTALIRYGVDVMYVLVGARPVIREERLTETERILICSYRALAEKDQAAIAYLVTILAAFRRTVDLRRGPRPEYNFEKMVAKVLGSNLYLPLAARRANVPS